MVIVFDVLLGYIAFSVSEDISTLSQEAQDVVKAGCAVNCESGKLLLMRFRQFLGQHHQHPVPAKPMKALVRRILYNKNLG